MKHQPSSKTKQVNHKVIKQDPTNGTVLQTADSYSGPLAVSADEETIEERIRIRAHQLYKERGAQDGFDIDDWLQAERELLASS